MKNFLKQYFTFNNKEKRGIFVLLSIILLLLLILVFQNKFISKEQLDYSEFEKQIDNFEQAHQVNDSEKIDESIEANVAANTPVENKQLFPFNPNQLSEENWKKLSLSEKQIRTIKNYEAKGGKFYKKEDLKKIYGITETLFQSLEPYIQIPDSPHPSPSGRRTEDEGAGALAMIELNNADSTALVQLKGIGPSFAKRIIKYRELLGGFSNKEQLLEVYGFDKEKLELISPTITVDSKRIKPVNINKVSPDELKKHPYIKYQIANLIVNYRSTHGPYKGIEEIKKLHLMNEDLYVKLAPYLIIE